MALYVNFVKCFHACRKIHRRNSQMNFRDGWWYGFTRFCTCAVESTPKMTQKVHHSSCFTPKVLSGLSAKTTIPGKSKILLKYYVMLYTRNTLDCDQSNYSLCIVFSHIPIEFGKKELAPFDPPIPKTPS